jgi:uncharacterized membrane protein YkgB
MNLITSILIKLGILKDNVDYHFARASMVIIFLFFGYQKWFQYEAQGLIPYISHGPLIFWMYSVFSVRGATWFLGVSEWLFGALLFWGFWNKKAGILGALGSCFSFIATFTIIPFFPNGWEASAGGFPAMTEHVGFLMKDLVLLAVSFYLLREDLKTSFAACDRIIAARSRIPSERLFVHSSGTSGAQGISVCPILRVSSAVFESRR